MRTIAAVALALALLAGCAHHAKTPDFSARVPRGATALLVPPDVAVSILGAGDAEHSAAARAHVEAALAAELERRGLVVVRLGGSPEDAALATELNARYDEVSRLLEYHFVESGWLSGGLPPGAVRIAPVADVLAARGAELVVFARGSDDVSTVKGVLLGLVGLTSGDTKLMVAIAVASGEVVYFDRQEETETTLRLWWRSDAFAVTHDLMSHLPRLEARPGGGPAAPPPQAR